jgi:hypothetical protein
MRTGAVLLQLLVFLGFGAAARAEEADGLDLETKSELGVYVDTDAVSVITPAVQAALENALEGWSLTGSYLADIVSAASVDIVSTASPRWTEVRHAGSLSGAFDAGDTTTSVSGAASREPDYLSLTGGLSERMALAERTVTPFFGYSTTRDEAGRTGTPFSVYSLILWRHAVTAGVELVVDRSTVFTLVGDAAFESGRQEKPYRFLPLFAPEVAGTIPAGASQARVNLVRLPGRIGERVPEERRRFAVSGRLAHRLSAATLIVSERLYQDDWGLRASTTELRMSLDAGQRWFLSAHLRGHLQTGVSFWQRAYVARPASSGLEVPRLRTGDRELGPLASATLGGSVRWLIGRAARPDAVSLVVQSDVTTTSFSDALFLRDRQSFFNTLQLEAKF